MKKWLYIFSFLFVSAELLRADYITNIALTAISSDVESTVSVAKFNSNLGTLTGIYIEFTTALYAGYYEFDNDSTTTKRYPSITLSMDILSFSTAVRLDGTGISADGSDLSIYDLFSLTLQKNDGDTVGQFNTGGTDYGVLTPESSVTASGNVDSSVFADYIGTGTFDIFILANFIDTLTLPSDVFASLDNTASSGQFYAKIVYEYAAVPEPAAVGLISLGAIITLAATRLRRKTA